MCWRSATRERGTCSSRIAENGYFINANDSRSLLRPRSRLRSRIIATLCADGQFAVVVRTGIHFHLTITTLGFRRRRFVSNGVLGANIVGHSAADGVNFVQRFGEESDAASSLGHNLQCPFGVFGVLFLLQNADGVNGGSAVALQTPHRLLQSFGALVVVSVRNYKKDFLFELRVSFQMVGGVGNRIIKRRSATRLDFFESFLQLLDVGSEILVKPELVVEVDNAHGDGNVFVAE